MKKAFFNAGLALFALTILLYPQYPKPGFGSGGGVGSSVSKCADLSDAKTGCSTTVGTIATHATSEYLSVANNLSEGTAGTMRTNLGLGTIATFASSAYAAVANNLSDISNAATALANLGGVPTSRTVAGKALSSNITIACGDLSNAGAGCTAGAAPSITQGAFASLPATCTTNDLYIYTDTVYNPARCSGTNTWSQFYPAAGKVTLPPATGGYAWGSTQGTAAVTATRGQWVFTAPAGGGDQARYFYQNASYPSTSYTFTIGMVVDLDCDNNFFGLGVSDGTKFLEFHVGCNSGNVANPGTLGFSWTNQTTVSALAGTAFHLVGGALAGRGLVKPQYLTIQDDLSSTITAWWSDDLSNLQKTQLYSASRTAILTPSRVGILASNKDTNASTAYIFHMAGTGGFTP